MHFTCFLVYGYRSSDLYPSRTTLGQNQGYTNSGHVSPLVRIRAFQQYMTCLYRHVIYRWKAQNLSFSFGRGTRSCIRVHGSGVPVHTTMRNPHAYTQSEMHICTRRHNKISCTHVGQEIPVLVYALLICKLVCCSDAKCRSHKPRWTDRWKAMHKILLCMSTGGLRNCFS